MPISIDNRVKKRDGVARYRVIHNYTDAHGKHKKVERLVWGRAEAQQMEIKLKTEYGKQGVVVSRITVDELFEKYEKYHAIDTKQTTHENTMRRLRLRVLPYFEGKRLDKITQEDFAEWKVKINALNLETSTKQTIFKTFVAFLNYAVKMDHIQKNGLAALGNFKDTEKVEKPPEPIRYYTSEQFEQFIGIAKANCNTIKDWDYYVFFCIAYFTGARKGEIHALKWSDIDGNIWRIRSSISQKVKNVADYKTGTKNKSSNRDLQLPEPLIAVLNEHKERYKELAKERFNENKLVCGYDLSLRDTTLRDRCIKYAKLAGVPEITIHEFRHSHASLLANEGINIQEVARRLGHANVQETWNTYAHLYPREEERAVVILNKVGTG